jgi:hypothetical protein
MAMARPFSSAMNTASDSAAEAAILDRIGNNPPHHPPHMLRLMVQSLEEQRKKPLLAKIFWKGKKMIEGVPNVKFQNGASESYVQCGIPAELVHHRFSVVAQLEDLS